MRRLGLSLAAVGLLGVFAGSASAGGWHGHGRGPYCGPPVVYRPAPVYRAYYPPPYVVPAPIVYPAPVYPAPTSGFAFSNRNFSIWFGH